MESQSVSTDPAILVKEDDTPQVALETTSSTPGNGTNENHRYQRDEQFHLGLKQAASRRRQIAKDQEHQNFGRHSQEAAIARALHAAATEYCLPNASEFDDSFFYAAVDLAIKGSKLPLDYNRGQDESSLKISDDLSLPDMIDTLVNRSTRTIIQQKQEIHCLRLVVRELMQELLSADGDEEVSRTIAAQISNSTTFESPHKKYDPSMMTPTTASTTIATPDSFSATSQPFQAFGSNHSSEASHRHLVTPKYFSNSSLSVASVDSPTAMTSQLKDVQKSLDATMKETEQNQAGFMAKLDGCSTSVLFDRQAQVPNSSLVSPPAETNGLTVQPSKMDPIDLPKTAIRSIDNALLPSPDVIQPSSRMDNAENSIQQTQSGSVVESIINAIFEKSMEIIGNKASVGSPLPTRPEQLSREAGTSDDVSTISSGVGMLVRDIIDIDNSDKAIEQDTLQVQVSGPGETAGSLQKPGAIRNVDPPARLTRIESKNFGLDEVLSFGLGEALADSDPTRLDVNDSNESDTHKPHIFEDLEQDDDSDNDPGNVYGGGRRMVVLTSTAIADPMQSSHQEQFLAILRGDDIEVEFVDGADPKTEEIRECLFAVSGISHVYPQFFMVDDDGMTEFLGNFKEMKQLYNNGELKSAMLRMSTAPGARQEEKASVGHQEEKKDEQPANGFPGGHVATLSPRSWDQGAHTNGGQNRDGKDYHNAMQANGVQSTTVTENNDPPMFIRDEGFSWIDPSPLYVESDVSGKLAVIKEDPTGVNESFLSTESSDLNNSNDVFEEGRRKLRWI